jgi:predicted glycosyltransferase involved in capsule biosynthesis
MGSTSTWRLLLRREMLVDLGGFDESLRGAADTDLIVRLMLRRICFASR